MDYTFDTSTTLESKFISEDYFPAIIQFSSEELNNRFIEFNYNDTDMFELIGSSKDGIIKQLTLTLCNHFEEMDLPLNIPKATEGAIFFNKSATLQCDKFNLFIHKNGLHIDISDKSACTHLRCGQLIFALDECDSLVSLYVIDLSHEDISHILQEVHSIEN